MEPRLNELTGACSTIGRRLARVASGGLAAD